MPSKLVRMFKPKTKRYSNSSSSIKLADQRNYLHFNQSTKLFSPFFISYKDNITSLPMKFLKEKKKKTTSSGFKLSKKCRCNKFGFYEKECLL
jgi:hypothetical protein